MKIKKINKDISLFKPNQLIEVVNRPISIIGLKAYNYILKKLQDNRTSNITIAPSEILANIGTSNSFEELYHCLDELQKTQVTSIDAKGRTWGGFVLLSAFKKTDNALYLEIPQIIAKELFQNNNLYYTTIKLLEEKSFKSSYSILFYEIFKKYEKVNIPIFTVENLKAMTGTTEKYKEYKYFKRDVLRKALEEINKYDNNYFYSYEESKLGKRVEKIQFIREEKNIITNDDVELSSKMITAVKKAKKSIYIQKCFSEKALKKLLSKYDEGLVIKALGECAKFNEEIKSFSALMIAKIDDIQKSKTTEKVDILEVFEDEKNEKKQIFENNKNEDELEILKNKLLKNSKNENMPNEFLENCIKACKNVEDLMFLAHNFKIKI